MNKLLDQLDEFLESQKDSEQKVFFFLPVLLFGFLSYYFLYPVTDENLKNSVQESNSLKTKILATKNDNIRLKNSNLRLSAIIKKEDKALVILHKNQKEVDELVKELMFLKFDLNKWADFYNKIPNMAQKAHLIIQSLQNDMLLESNKALINKKMSLKINLTGNFVDFIKFMNKFESKKELVKIKSIEINGLNMILEIDIYGAEL